MLLSIICIGWAKYWTKRCVGFRSLCWRLDCWRWCSQVVNYSDILFVIVSMYLWYMFLLFNHLNVRCALSFCSDDISLEGLEQELQDCKTDDVCINNPCIPLVVDVHNLPNSYNISWICLVCLEGSCDDTV